MRRRRRSGTSLTLIALSALLNGVARLGSRFAITGGCQYIESDIRGELFAALQRFPPRFYATHSTGDLMARSTSDITAVRSLLGFGALSLVSTTFSFVGVLAAMLAVDPWLTLWSLAPSPVLVLLARRFNTRVNERTQAAQDQLSVLSERVQEYVAGMSVVRAYTLEPRARADFGRANAEYLRLSLALARTEAGFSPLMGLIAGIGTLIVIWAGGRAVVDGRLTLGALVAFNGYLAYLTWPTLALGWTLVDRPPRPDLDGSHPGDRRGVQRPERAGDGTGGHDDPGHPVLAPHVHVHRSGARTARRELRGARRARRWPWSAPPGAASRPWVFCWRDSGSRRPGPCSSAVATSPRFRLDALRASIGYVPQEGFLFSRSIADNITLGREGLGRDELDGAARVAGIAEEIERFAAGFEAVVGERGLTLSGGQRQRVTLARALAGAPEVLVLDDAFASVDAAKEEEILTNLRQALAGRTVLLDDAPAAGRVHRQPHRGPRRPAA